MQPLEEKLGYTFQDKRLLENALTHSSYANEHRGSDTHSNERLEFLGDSILGLVVADHLYRTRPDLPEGDLTRIRAALVCENSLVEVAQSLDLGSYLRLGKGEDHGGGRARGQASVSVPADTDPYEAEREKQKAVKLSFFYAARDLTGVTPPWGALTGIRPGKLAARLLELLRKEETK